MHRHELLAGLHERLAPRTYFEIGVEVGRSLTLSRTCSVGVDPFFSIKRELQCDLQLVRTTSDEFFARDEPFAHFPVPVVDLAFIDGMHLAEYLLRDIINTERHAHATTVIVLDDMLPRNAAEASRDRAPGRAAGAWAGDVYKVIEVIRRHRPDLVCLELDTTPTGTVALMVPDPANQALLRAYDGLVEELVTRDGDPPQSVLGRTRAIDPRALLEATVWSHLRELRELPDESARPLVRDLLAAAGLGTPG